VGGAGHRKSTRDLPTSTGPCQAGYMKTFVHRRWRSLRRRSRREPGQNKGRPLRSAAPSAMPIPGTAITPNGLRLYGNGPGLRTSRPGMRDSQTALDGAGALTDTPIRKMVGSIAERAIAFERPRSLEPAAATRACVPDDVDAFTEGGPPLGRRLRLLARPGKAFRWRPHGRAIAAGPDSIPPWCPC